MHVVMYLEKWIGLEFVVSDVPQHYTDLLSNFQAVQRLSFPLVSTTSPSRTMLKPLGTLKWQSKEEAHRLDTNWE